MTEMCVICKSVGEWSGVCPTCRRHARIWRAVEGMPAQCSLLHDKDSKGEFWYLKGRGVEKFQFKPTALAALEATGLVKEE